MSLTWDLTEIEDWEALHEDEIEKVITETMIWATLGNGIGHITEKNAAEFYARCEFVGRLWGGPYQVEGENRRLTPMDVKRRIGLRTNVHGEETRLKWLKRFTADLNQFEYAYERVMKEDHVDDAH